MTDLPFWLESALAVPSETGSVDVAGANIVYETWGEIGNPGIVLIHGSNAHLEWWRFTAPFLADNFRVAALDLSGNGNSDWRERYTGELLAEEVWQVCQAAELGDKPFVVGHSFGGWVALETGKYHDAELGGILFMDFTIAPPEDYLEWGLRAEREGVDPGRKLRVYEEKEAALKRFRFIPEQPGVHPAVLNHLAEYGLKKVDGGWTWKFDPALFDHMEMGAAQRDTFTQLTTNTALMLGEKSEDEGAFYAEHMLAITDGLLPAITVPGTYHHLMFDQPLAVAMAMKILLLEWHRQNNHAAYEAALSAVSQAGN
ncbi:MAG: pimeloyl-ACP methyl ester carboxylesterase [Candidatus Azotimanducaceae bacterium]|jgi:pimeloyl-ACP methyl ester carboxylesterase|tara:strand:- start:1438 stop:2379 length:942 start_codon:yes stop_codon:yes gene_type:complete